MIDARLLHDGGQTAEEIAGPLVAWLSQARASLDIALYDVRLPGPIGDAVADALRAAAARGVAVRIAYNADDGPSRKPIPPPPGPSRRCSSNSACRCRRSREPAT